MALPPLLPEYVPDVDLWMERSNLAGIIIAGVAYGILFTVFFQCLLLLWTNGGSRAKQARWLMLYSTLVFALASGGFGGNVKFIQMTYIDYRNYPGGPNAWTFDYYTDPVNVFSIVCYVLMNWMVDGLLVYRFSVIYNASNKFTLLILPGLMYLGILGCSISMICFTVLPSYGFFVQPTLNIGTAYWSLSIALNIGLTIAICVRLLRMRANLRKALGPNHSSPYTSVLSMLIESAALYTSWALVFLVTYARADTFQNVVLPSLGQIQGIAPLLIILRVAQGKAWTSSTGTTTANNMSTLQSNGRNPHSTLGNTVTSSRGGQSYPLSNMTETSTVQLEIDMEKTVIHTTDNGVSMRKVAHL